MRQQVLYISHPIAGYPDQNRIMAAAAANQVRFCKGIPLQPLEITPKHSGTDPEKCSSVACYLRGDLLAMLDAADGIVLCPGWEASVGCRLELQVAAACGLDVYFYDALACVFRHGIAGGGITEVNSFPMVAS